MSIILFLNLRIIWISQFSTFLTRYSKYGVFFANNLLYYKEVTKRIIYVFFPYKISSASLFQECTPFG